MKRSPYVLVVSADAERCQEQVLALASRGLSAFACGSAREALCAPRPEILVTDLELPDHDGLELCEALMAGSSPIAAVLMVDCASVDVYRRAMHLGISDLLPQDCEESELAEAVEAANQNLYPEAEPCGWQRSVPSTAASCEHALRELTAWLLIRGVCPSTRCRIATAVGEAFENARRHAYAGDIGTIEIHAGLEGGTLEIEVRDRGEGMLSGVPRSRAGRTRGFDRMASLCEELDVQSHPHLGTRIRLTFCVHHTWWGGTQNGDYEDFDFLAPDHVRSLLADLTGAELPEGLILSPAVAVTVGRLLAGPLTSQPQPSAL
ncbi:MAG: ATP-binding protein [Planctomycetota bacterium]